MDAALPPGWRWATIGAVCAVNPPRARRIDRDPDALTTFVPLPAVDAATGTITGALLRPYGDLRGRYLPFVEGDVLFARIMPCLQNGKHAVARGLVDGVGFGSTEFHVLRPGAEVQADWLHAWVRRPAFLAAAADRATGAADQKRVPEDYVRTAPIALPSADLQARLAASAARVVDLLAQQARLAVVVADHRGMTARTLAAAMRDLADAPSPVPHHGGRGISGAPVP